MIEIIELGPAVAYSLECKAFGSDLSILSRHFLGRKAGEKFTNIIQVL